MEQRPEQHPSLSPELARAVGLRAETHRRILVVRPELRRFMFTDPRSRAELLAGVGTYLKANPDLDLIQEIAFHDAKPNDISMLVQPRYPFVLYKTDGGPLMAMVPGTSITTRAINDLFRGHRAQFEHHKVVTAQGAGLVDEVWKMASRDPMRVLPYDRNRYSPEQHLAMAATGMISNEVFRIPVVKLLER
jgi:hypothetical protein